MKFIIPFAIAATLVLILLAERNGQLVHSVASLTEIVSIIDKRVDDLEAKNVKTVEIHVERFWDDDAKQYDYKMVSMKEE